jgi:hypothetical protein
MYMDAVIECAADCINYKHEGHSVLPGRQERIKVLVNLEFELI